jgi:spore coat polysaccharide biosynthesis predicted glycosyltransferase SpsG
MNDKEFEKKIRELERLIISVDEMSQKKYSDLSVQLHELREYLSLEYKWIPEHQILIEKRKAKIINEEERPE